MTRRTSKQLTVCLGCGRDTSHPSGVCSGCSRDIPSVEDEYRESLNEELSSASGEVRAYKRERTFLDGNSLP